MSEIFIAAGFDGARTASTDGKTWIPVVVGKEGETYRASAAGAGKIALVGSFGGDNLLAYSKDGRAWEVQKQNAFYSKYVRGMGFGKGTFVGLGGDPGSVGAANPFVLTSTDGQKWSALQEIGGKFMLRRLAFGAEQFVAVGDRGRRAGSPDGVQWKDAPDVKAIDTLVDIAFGKDRFVGVGLHGLRMITEDGVTWHDRQTGEEGEHLNSIVWAKDHFVAVGPEATLTSPDGVKWERHANQNSPFTLCHGGGEFVGLRWKGRIVRSADGISWEEVFRAEQHFLTVCMAEI